MSVHVEQPGQIVDGNDLLAVTKIKLQSKHLEMNLVTFLPEKKYICTKDLQDYQNIPKDLQDVKIPCGRSLKTS